MFYDLPGPSIVLYLVPSMSFSLLLSLSFFLYLPFCLVPSTGFYDLPWGSTTFHGFPGLCSSILPQDSMMFHGILWDSHRIFPSFHGIPWHSMVSPFLPFPSITFNDIPSSSGTLLSLSPSFYDLLWPSTALLRIFLDLPQGSVAFYSCFLCSSFLILLGEVLSCFPAPTPGLLYSACLVAGQNSAKKAQNIAEPFSMRNSILKTIKKLMMWVEPAMCMPHDLLRSGGTSPSRVNKVWFPHERWYRGSCYLRIGPVQGSSWL